MIDPTAENLISSAALAEVLGLSEQRIRQLSDDGVLESKGTKQKKLFDLAPSVRAYIDFLKNSTTASYQDYRLKKAKADKIELELEELRGTMHRAEDVETITNDMIGKLRAALLALPGRLAVDTAEARSATETSAIIKQGVDEVLNDTAAYTYDPAEYRKRVREREKWADLEEARAEAETQKENAQKSVKKPPASSKSSARASRPRKT